MVTFVYKLLIVRIMIRQCSIKLAKLFYSSEWDFVSFFGIFVLKQKKNIMQSISRKRDKMKVEEKL